MDSPYHQKKRESTEIEGVQRQVTKAIRSLERLTHGERFNRLGLFNLQEEVKRRRLTRDIKTVKDRGMITQAGLFPLQV